MDKGKSSSRSRSSSDSFPVRRVDLHQVLNLFPGRVLNARVNSFLSESEEEPDQFILNIQGYRVVAESELDLTRGEPLLVEVQTTDRPIEVKIINPRDVPDGMKDPQFENLIKGTRFESKQVPRDYLEAVLEHHGQLDFEGLERSLDSREFMDPDPRSRYRALDLVNEAKLPFREQILDNLEELPRLDQLDNPWNSLATEKNEDPDIRELIRSLGIDYISRIPSDPEEAGSTLHPAVLEETRSNNPSARSRQLLAQLLSLAIANSSSENICLVLPIPIKGSIRLMRLVATPDPSAARSRRLNMQIPIHPDSSYDLEADLTVRPGKIAGQWVIPQQLPVDRVVLNRELGRLTETLEQTGYTVQWSLQTGEPSRVDPFQASDDLDQQLMGNVEVEI